MASILDSGKMERMKEKVAFIGIQEKNSRALS